jgi:helix-turn-helix protein
MNTPYYCFSCSVSLGELYRYPPSPDVCCDQCMSPLGDDERRMAIDRANAEALTTIAKYLGVNGGSITAVGVGGDVETSPHAQRDDAGSDVLDTDAAVAYLRLPSRAALYAAVRRGAIPDRRVGKRSMRFYRSELDAVLRRSHGREAEKVTARSAGEQR